MVHVTWPSPSATTCQRCSKAVSNARGETLKLNRPGVVIEVDARTAEALGAFEEDALDEAEALASADTDGQGVH